MSQTAKVEEEREEKMETEPDTTCIFWPTIPCPVLKRKEHVKDRRRKAEAMLKALKPTMRQSDMFKDLDSFMEKLVPLLKDVSSISPAAEYCIACALFKYPTHYAQNILLDSRLAKLQKNGKVKEE